MNDIIMKTLCLPIIYTMDWALNCVYSLSQLYHNEDRFPACAWLLPSLSNFWSHWSSHHVTDFDTDIDNRGLKIKV